MGVDNDMALFTNASEDFNMMVHICKWQSRWLRACILIGIINVVVELNERRFLVALEYLNVIIGETFFHCLARISDHECGSKNFTRR